MSLVQHGALQSRREHGAFLSLIFGHPRTLPGFLSENQEA